MITVGQLSTHLQTLEPHKNPARLTFFNFVKLGLPQDIEFKLDHIDLFYDRVLGNQYWQTNKNILGEQLKRDLNELATRVNLPIDFSQIVHANDMQLVNIEYARDFASLLAKQVSKMESAGEKVKSFRLPNERSGQQEVLFVRLQKDGSLIVEIRQNTSIVVDGELQLVRPHTRLIYDAELDFEFGVDQVIQISPMRLCYFRLTQSDSQKIKGHYVQYPHLQCTETFDKPLREATELFHAIKKIERYFVNPITDPYFQQFFESINSGTYEKQI